MVTKKDERDWFFWLALVLCIIGVAAMVALAVQALRRGFQC